jgi:formylglycine-generating enzyme required for sulfatase activity
MALVSVKSFSRMPRARRRRRSLLLAALLACAVVVATGTPAPAAEDAAPSPAPAASSAKAPAVKQTSDAMIPIAAGSFFMGCKPEVDSECTADEQPGGEQELPAFVIDRTEVTVAQFAACVDQGGCSSEGLTMPYFDGSEHPDFAEFCNWQKRDDHPINCVTWEQARTYCQWAGKRLPTEAEWEKAARGTDGRKYPWGNDGFDKGTKVANIADESAGKRFPELDDIAADYDDGFVGTAPVGSFPAGASPGGALDMIGNVGEWTSNSLVDGYAVRGGSFYRGPSHDRASARLRGGRDSRTADVGFRCIR